jgi:hypothetical protein
LAAGVAVSVTFVPESKFDAQLPGQLIPAGLLVTVPVPEAGAVTLSGYVVVENFAPTVWELVMVTLQLAVPEQAPVQPENV